VLRPGLCERLETRAQIGGFASRSVPIPHDRSEAEKRYDDKDENRDKRDASEHKHGVVHVQEEFSSTLIARAAHPEARFDRMRLQRTRQLSLVTIEQMIAALVRNRKSPPAGTMRIVDVAAILSV
jgi:hypothetical protein